MRIRERSEGTRLNAYGGGCNISLENYVSYGKMQYFPIKQVRFIGKSTFPYTSWINSRETIFSRKLQRTLGKHVDSSSGRKKIKTRIGEHVFRIGTCSVQLNCGPPSLSLSALLLCFLFEALSAALMGLYVIISTNIACIATAD